MAVDDILVAWRYPVTDGLEEAEVDRRTAIDMYQQLQEVCSTKLLSSPVILGGLGVVAQIDHLYARTKEFINTLIAVTSWLDAAVTSINVLNPMENLCCGMFKCMQWFKYMIHVNFANSSVMATKFHTLSSLLEANRTYWQRVIVQSISILWWKQLKTKAKWLVAAALWTISC